MAARIYADVTGNKCQCGGAYSKRVPHPDDKELIVPRCSECNEYPSLFIIDADARDPNGVKIRVKIRNDQNNNRLEKISQVVFTVETIQKEILEGIFDVNKYCSKEARDSFIFKNYVEKYLAHHERRLLRGEITPKGLRDKKGLINTHLLPFFGTHDITKINDTKINAFKDSFTDRFRTRDLALGELRTLLRQAKKDKLLVQVPDFDKIPKAKMRTSIISLELARKTIELIPRKMYRDMLTLLTIYPMRPSELRALKWKDLDFNNETILVQGHFSDEVWTKGRKSVKEGPQSEIEFPMIDLAKDIFNDARPLVRPLDWKEQYVFVGRSGKQVYDSKLAEAWNKARETLGHSHHLYEIRHRCLTDYAKRHNGDIVKMMRVSGHTNPHTLISRYIRDKSSMKEDF